MAPRTWVLLLCAVAIVATAGLWVLRNRWTVVKLCRCPPRCGVRHALRLPRRARYDGADGRRRAACDQSLFSRRDATGKLPTVLIRAPYNKNTTRVRSGQPTNSRGAVTWSPCRTCAASTHRKGSSRPVVWRRRTARRRSTGWRNPGRTGAWERSAAPRWEKRRSCSLACAIRTTRP